MKTVDSPIVSVIMPVYNEESWLHQSIPSILNQTFEDFELIIINDASTDNSLEIIKHYIKQDSRIRLYNNSKNSELIETLNKGIALANGKYIARMDADDISLPDRLNIQLSYLNNHPEIQLIGTGCEVIDEENQRLKTTNTGYLPYFLVKLCLIFDNVFTHGSIMCSSELLKENLYAPWAVDGEDYELWVRLKEMCKMVRIPDILYKFRSHVNSISRDRMSLCKIAYKISCQQIEAYIGENFDRNLLRYLINCKVKRKRNIVSLFRAVRLLNKISIKFKEMNNLSSEDAHMVKAWTRKYKIKVLRKHLLGTIFL